MPGKLSSRLVILILCVLVFLLFTGCVPSSQGSKATNGNSVNSTKIVFGEGDWDSIRLHNNIAQFIIQYGYGYDTDTLKGTEKVIKDALAAGKVDIIMEYWAYEGINNLGEQIKKGDITQLSINYSDDMMGFYVPTYLVKGDPGRGIKPMAPDLDSVKDLPKYKFLFEDPASPGKGILHGDVIGWDTNAFMLAKYKGYGLQENYNFIQSKTEEELTNSLVYALENGQPWVGYYWTPTWVMGKYDLTLLTEPAYSDEVWNKNYLCQYKSIDIPIVASKDFGKKAPDVAAFLKNYKTDSALTSQALAYMHDKRTSMHDAAKWFLKQHQDLWTRWVPEDVAGKVREALK